MSVDTGNYNIAGVELAWPIGVGAGYTNHPYIEVIARRTEEIVATGIGSITLGSWKLGDASGGSAHLQQPDGSWMYVGGDEHEDPTKQLGYNTKSLPGPGIYAGLERLSDLLAITKQRGVVTGLSLSPHTQQPLQEIPELLAAAEVALRIGVDYIEFNLSCPNIPDRPAFYKDTASVYEFLQLVNNWRTGVLRNHIGKRALFLKFCPMEDGGDDRMLRETVISHRDKFGGIVTSNTIGNQEPKLLNGEPAIKVNGGKAGMSGPGCAKAGAEQLRLWQTSRGSRDLQILSVLGIGYGDEAYQRLSDGADSVQAVSPFYWPSLVKKDSAGAVFEDMAKQFTDAFQASIK